MKPFGLTGTSTWLRFAGRHSLGADYSYQKNNHCEVHTSVRLDNAKFGWLLHFPVSFQVKLSDAVLDSRAMQQIALLRVWSPTRRFCLQCTLH